MSKRDDLIERIARALAVAKNGEETHWRAFWQDALRAAGDAYNQPPQEQPYHFP